MTNKDLIICLIQQDLKHNQLVNGLESLGLEVGGMHCLNLLELVSELMEVPEGKVHDAWCSLYTRYMNEAMHYAIAETTEPLRPLAEVCYNRLREIASSGSV